MMPLCGLSGAYVGLWTAR